MRLWKPENQGASCTSLILWASIHLNLPVEVGKYSQTSDIIYPISLIPKSIESKIMDSILEEATISEEIKSKVKDFFKTENSVDITWVAIINHQEPIEINSEITNWYIVDNLNTQDVNDYTFWISKEKPPERMCKLIHKLLQEKDGGWCLKGWRFLFIYRNAKGKSLYRTKPLKPLLQRVLS